jgi:lipoprotein-anchoring transpeptidase ErfK/SrfK
MRIALVLSLALAIPAVAAGDVGGAERPGAVHVAAANRPPLAVGDVQGRLAALGFLAPTGVDGHEGPRTASAVTAFQKWVGERSDGSAGPRTQAALARATRPSPVDRRGPGRRVEVLLDRQLVLAVEDDRVVRALPTSTGAAGSPTPSGEFRIEAKHDTWWSKPFASGWRWRCRSPAARRSTRPPTCPRTPPRTGACASLPGTPSGSTASHRSATA